jgi:hypothetical protein
MIKSSGSRKRTARRGAAIVEFALVAPVFFALILGIIEFGLMLIVRLDTEKALGSLKIESHYTTNDPSRPVLTVTLLADIQRP